MKMLNEFDFHYYIDLKVQLALLFGLNILKDDVEGYRAHLEEKYKHRLKSKS